MSQMLGCVKEGLVHIVLHLQLVVIQIEQIHLKLGGFQDDNCRVS